MAHRIGQLVARDRKIADRLSFDLLAVNVQRNRHRAKIFRLFQCILRARLALIRQLVTHFIAIVGVERTCGLDQALLTRKIN